jgi:hypothetical protein
MGRRRLRLVPDEGREIFEIRIALYFDSDGSRQVATTVEDPQDGELDSIDLIEMLGAIEYGRRQLRESYQPEDG